MYLTAEGCGKASYASIIPESQNAAWVDFTLPTLR